MINNFKVFPTIFILAIALFAMKGQGSKTVGSETKEPRNLYQPAELTKPTLNMGADASINSPVDLKSIDDFQGELKDLSDETLQMISQNSKATIQSKELMAKANAQSLTPEESMLLSTELNKQSAAEIILIDRRLEELSRKQL